MVNSVGQSETSDPNTSGAVMLVEPLQPDDIFLDTAQTNEYQIGLSLPEVTSLLTGGSPIISYNLQWDSGTGTGFYSIYGETSNSLLRSYIETRVTGGSTYRFRYRVKNLFGWSPFSNILTAYPGVIPDVPSQIRTENSGTSVVISWNEPYNGGDKIF